MKVLFVIDTLGPGGAERSLYETLTLADGRIEPLIACLYRRQEGVERAALRRGFDVRFLDARDRVGRVRDLRRLIRSERPAVVHTTLFEADITGRFAAAGTGVPVLTSLVNTPYASVRLQDPNLTRWKLWAVRLIDGWTARHLTTHFHAISDAVKEAAVRDLGLDPDLITVIRRGRDPMRLGMASPARRASARLRLGISLQVPVIVSVGRQEFQKGQWHLLEAMPKVLASHPNARILIAGREGNASGRLRAVMRTAALDGSVELLGYREDVPEILAAADLFVFPSLYEGLGGALIEAMALGLPIVASDLPAIREVVEDGRNAILVPPASPPDLAEAIERLIEDPGRRAAMGMRSREIFEERFTLDRSVERMVELYRRVAGK